MDGLIPYVLISTHDHMVEMRGSEQRKIPACKECRHVAAGTVVDIHADRIRSPFSVSGTAGGQVLVFSTPFLRLFPSEALAGVAFGKVLRHGRHMPDLLVANVPTRLVIRGEARNRDIPAWRPRFTLCTTCGEVLHRNRNGRLAIDSLHATRVASLKPGCQPGLAVSAGDLLIRRDLFPLNTFDPTRNESASDIPFSVTHADGMVMPWE
ncbi:MAG: hypothetical protein L6R48_22300 [Planctomycetes bacterium]|nr:hypothetical protein [Planctomycetota bacterium]